MTNIIKKCNSCGNTCLLTKEDFYEDDEIRWIKLPNGKIYCTECITELTDSEFLDIMMQEKLDKEVKRKEAKDAKRT